MASDELMRRFQRAAARRGVRKMAADLPAHRSTIYRWLKKRNSKPSRALEEAIKRVVKEEEDKA